VTFAFFGGLTCMFCDSPTDSEPRTGTDADLVKNPPQDDDDDRHTAALMIR